MAKAIARSGDVIPRCTTARLAARSEMGKKGLPSLGGFGLDIREYHSKQNLKSSIKKTTIIKW
jgi:hypothetical protein